MTTTAHVPAAVPVQRALFPRLGSLLAFLPLSVWTVWHIYTNLFAWKGAAPWAAAATADRAPVVEWTITALILLPILLHTVWGVRRLLIMQPNNQRYPWFGNLKYILQRISALGVLAFIVAHVYLARLSPQIECGRHELFNDFAWTMRNHLPTLVVYVLGTLGTTYHLGNGLATGGMTWGYAASPRAMRRMNAISIGTFVVTLAMSWGAIAGLYVAGASAVDPHQGEACGNREVSVAR